MPASLVTFGAGVVQEGRQHVPSLQTPHRRRKLDWNASATKILSEQTRASSLIEPVSEPLPVRRKASASPEARPNVTLQTVRRVAAGQTLLVDEQDESSPAAQNCGIFYADADLADRDRTQLNSAQLKSLAWMSWPTKRACSAHVPLLTPTSVDAAVGKAAPLSMRSAPFLACLLLCSISHFRPSASTLLGSGIQVHRVGFGQHLTLVPSRPRSG